MVKKVRRKRTILRIETPDGYAVNIGVEDVIELLFGKKPKQLKERRGDDGVPIIDLRGEDFPKKKKKKRIEDEEDNYYADLANLGKSK